MKKSTFSLAKVAHVLKELAGGRSAYVLVSENKALLFLGLFHIRQQQQ
ncbi:hypothetical protein P0M11_09015 [Kaistella sp. PBT33-4]|nr:hypothetical protein [Kaistella sp. PBT33-4]MDF0720138.1 hypothetical protein [Kaistella sp. PBT33-4]